MMSDQKAVEQIARIFGIPPVMLQERVKHDRPPHAPRRQNARWPGDAHQPEKLTAAA